METSLFPLNESAAQAFSEISQYLELKGENPFKIKAYVKASRVLRTLETDLEELSLEGKLRSIDGVGKAIADKLEAFIKTGTIPQLEALKQEIPRGLVDVSNLPGLGSKKTVLLHKELGVSDLESFKAVLEAGKVEEVKGFSKKSQAKYLALVEKALSAETTFIKSRLEEWAQQTRERLCDVAGVTRIEVVGEVRRKAPQSSRLELLLVCSDRDAARQDVEQRFASTSSNMESREGALIFDHPSGCPIWLRFASQEEAGNLLLRWTGPDQFVASVEKKLSQAVSFPTEEAVFEAAKVPFVLPEIRHRKNVLKYRPVLLELSQIQGNLHAHTTYSDGQNSLEEMVQQAVDLGHSFFGVSDHSRSLVVANGLTEERLLEQVQEIRALNERRSDIEIFASNETDILEDGCLDYPDEVLQKLDYVVVAVHSFFHLSQEAMTQRLLAGVSHPAARILAHPTGRLLTRRDGYSADWEEVFKRCAERKVALEINSSPWRLDISEELLELAQECGCLIAINTDAHSLREFDYTRHGVDMARRGGLDPDRVVNTWDTERLKKWFKGEA